MRKSTCRNGTLLALIAAGSQLVACAQMSSSTGQEEVRTACRTGYTLICENRVAQEGECTCRSKDSMRDILEPGTSSSGRR